MMEQTLSILQDIELEPTRSSTAFRWAQGLGIR